MCPTQWTTSCSFIHEISLCEYVLSQLAGREIPMHCNSCHIIKYYSHRVRFAMVNNPLRTATLLANDVFGPLWTRRFGQYTMHKTPVGTPGIRNMVSTATPLQSKQVSDACSMRSTRFYRIGINNDLRGNTQAFALAEMLKDMSILPKPWNECFLLRPFIIIFYIWLRRCYYKYPSFFYKKLFLLGQVCCCVQLRQQFLMA